MNKPLFVIFLTILSIHVCAGQGYPIKWTYTAKHVNNNLFEIHVHATIIAGWHIFAQDQPPHAFGNPTEIILHKNPLIELLNGFTPVGKKIVYRDTILHITQHRYEREVDFVQKLRLKHKVKTQITGELTYQVCDEERCLFPPAVKFTVSIP